MAAFVVSVTGVIALGILLEVVLPEGKTAKYVKGAFSLLVVFVIVAPLPSLLKKDWSAELNFDLSADEDYVASQYLQNEKRLEEALEIMLSGEGISAEVDAVMRQDAPGLAGSVYVTLLCPADGDAVKDKVAARCGISRNNVFVSAKKEE